MLDLESGAKVPFCVFLHRLLARFEPGGLVSIQNYFVFEALQNKIVVLVEKLNSGSDGNIGTIATFGPWLVFAFFDWRWLIEAEEARIVLNLRFRQNDDHSQAQVGGHSSRMPSW